jgi:hypothetical protein
LTDILEQIKLEAAAPKRIARNQAAVRPATKTGGIAGMTSSPWLPRHPAVYDLTTRLVLTTRDPCRIFVLQVQAGQPLRLRRDPQNLRDSQAVRIETLTGEIVGYLDADTAAYLAILLDHYPGITDLSYAESVQTAAPPDDPAARRLRYPRLHLHVRLALASGWPLFVIAAVLGVKTDDFHCRFNLAGNAWLAPLQVLHEQYLRLGHDRFQLPEYLAKAWINLTEHHDDSAKTD